MRQITIRGFDRALERAVRDLASKEGISLNQAALRLLRRGAAATKSSHPSKPIGDRLDHLIGTWTAKEARDFDRAIADLERIDAELWQE